MPWMFHNLRNYSSAKPSAVIELEQAMLLAVVENIDVKLTEDMRFL